MRGLRAHLSAKLVAKRLLDEDLERRRLRGEEEEGEDELDGLSRRRKRLLARLARAQEVAEEWYWWGARVLRRGVWWSRGDRIRKIEGLYGTGIGTYFVFLRFLVLLNVCVAFLRYGGDFTKTCTVL